MQTHLFQHTVSLQSFTCFLSLSRIPLWICDPTLRLPYSDRHYSKNQYPRWGKSPFSPIFRGQKINTLFSHAFHHAVQMSGMTDAHSPRYPVMPNFDGSNTPFILEAYAGEEVIFPFQIDVGLRFPYSAALVELCQHFQIVPTQLFSNVIHSWAGFKILFYQRGWDYSLALFRCFFRLQCNPQGFSHFQTRIPSLKNCNWRGKRLFVFGCKLINSN